MFYTFFNKSFSFELETLTRKVFTKDITLSKNLIVFDSKKFIRENIIMSVIPGTYKRESQENMAAYLQTMGNYLLTKCFFHSFN